MPTLALKPKTSPKIKRYAIVGTGGRSDMYSRAIMTTYRKQTQLVALCDTNQTRMNFYNQKFKEEYQQFKPVPTYHADDFENMIRQCKPDTVIVTTRDCLHHDYMIRAMKMGCDVITEKPMTTQVDYCRQILQCVEKTGRQVRVAFNYRYSPLRSKTKELIMKGTIGEVKAVHFEWLLDTSHGADYFRRWHREKKNSGGLMVHKSTHHFDLVNWWLDSSPDIVFGMGNLAFYGRENAKKRGVKKFYERGTSPEAKGDPFALNLEKVRNGNLGRAKLLRGLYLNAEHEDGYLRDRSVFSDGITIEDTMSVLVRYKNGAQMTYSLIAYAPWEGYRISFTGTKGRIEVEHLEKSHINSANHRIEDSKMHTHRLLVFPHWEKPYEVEPPKAVGGHGGGDLPLLESLFGKPKKDPLQRSASHIDGARSILTGLAANRSFETGKAMKVDALIDLEDPS